MEDLPYTSLMFPSTSRSLSKGVHGIGAVVVESLREVWARSRVRVNNGLDNSIPPYSSQTGGLVSKDPVPDVCIGDLSCLHTVGKRPFSIVS